MDLVVSDHAVRRFSERVSEALEPASAVASLAADAQPPTDRQWRIVHRQGRCRQSDRGDFRILGTIVFVVRKGIVVTCWREPGL